MAGALLSRPGMVANMDRASIRPPDPTGQEGRSSLAPADRGSWVGSAPRESRPSVVSTPAVEASVSGALVATGRDVTRELIGTAAYEKALGWVPKEVAEEYRSATPLSWVPLS